MYPFIITSMTITTIITTILIFVTTILIFVTTIITTILIFVTISPSIIPSVRATKPSRRAPKMEEIPTKSPYDMIPMQEALHTIVSRLEPLGTESVPLSTSLHRRLSADIVSPTAHPPFRASVKDGYAVRFHAGGVPAGTCPSYRLMGGESLPGAAAPPDLSPGSAVYITTGAPVPPSADAVAMVEVCAASPDKVVIPAVAAGADIRPAGADIAKGATVLPAGQSVTPAVLGVLATCGLARVDVFERPVVGVLSTGDELVDSDQNGAPPHGCIVDSNRPMLLAAVADALPFCTCLDLGIAPDTRAAVANALRDAVDRCHIVVTSGGVSMGRKDVVKPLLAEMGTVHFGRVLMKPGKPLTFCTMAASRCVIALPGNPVSSFVCFHLAVCAAARRLAGWSTEHCFGECVDARLAHDIRLDAVRPEFHRASLAWRTADGAAKDTRKEFWASSTGGQSSSRLLSAVGADAFLALPARDGWLRQGDLVTAHLLAGLR